MCDVGWLSLISSNLFSITISAVKHSCELSVHSTVNQIALGLVKCFIERETLTTSYLDAQTLELTVGGSCSHWVKYGGQKVIRVDGEYGVAVRVRSDAK